MHEDVRRVRERYGEHPRQVGDRWLPPAPAADLPLPPPAVVAQAPVAAPEQVRR